MNHVLDGYLLGIGSEVSKALGDEAAMFAFVTQALDVIQKIDVGAYVKPRQVTYHRTHDPRRRSPRSMSTSACHMVVAEVPVDPYLTQAVARVAPRQVVRLDDSHRVLFSRAVRVALDGPLSRIPKEHGAQIVLAASQDPKLRREVIAWAGDPDKLRISHWTPIYTYEPTLLRYAADMWLDAPGRNSRSKPSASVDDRIAWRLASCMLDRLGGCGGT